MEVRKERPECYGCFEVCKKCLECPHFNACEHWTEYLFDRLKDFVEDG